MIGAVEDVSESRGAQAREERADARSGIISMTSIGRKTRSPFHVRWQLPFSSSSRVIVFSFDYRTLVARIGL